MADNPNPFLRNLSFVKNGDVLEVKLRDYDFNVVLAAKAHINDKREMRQLVNDLRKKGVSFPSGWFD